MASVTVIMPVKDEEEGLRLLVDEFKASPLAQRKDLSFIIVVDGRSSDMSREVSEIIADSVIDQNERHGKGDAIKAAISEWSENPTELLVMMDADGSYQWPDVENVIEALESGARGSHRRASKGRIHQSRGYEPPTSYGQSCVGSFCELKEQKKDTRSMFWAMGIH